MKNNFFVKALVLPVMFLGLTGTLARYHDAESIGLNSVNLASLAKAGAESFDECVKSQEAAQLKRYSGKKLSDAQKKTIKRKAESTCKKKLSAPPQDPAPVPVPAPPAEPESAVQPAPQPEAPVAVALPDFEITNFRLSEDFTMLYVDMANHGGALSQDLVNSWMLSVYIDDIEYAILSSGARGKDALFVANGSMIYETDTMYGGLNALQQGEHRVRGCVGSILIQESNLDNNCLTVQLQGEPLPDFTIDSVYLSEDYETLYFDLRNNGGRLRDGVNRWMLSAYVDDIDYALLSSGPLNKDPLFENNGRFLYSISTNDGGFSRLKQGSHHIYACAGLNVVTEGNRDNNCINVDLQGEPLPDFSIESITLTRDLNNLVFELRNNGGHLAEEYVNSWMLSAYMDDIDYAILSSGSLNKDELFVQNGSLTYTLSTDSGAFMSLRRGDHTIRACINTNVIPDSDPTNNCRTVETHGEFMPAMNVVDFSYDFPGVMKVVFEDVEGLNDFLEDTVVDEIEELRLCVDLGFRELCSYVDIRE